MFCDMEASKSSLGASFSKKYIDKRRILKSPMKAEIHMVLAD